MPMTVCSQGPGRLISFFCIDMSNRAMHILDNKTLAVKIAMKYDDYFN